MAAGKSQSEPLQVNLSFTVRTGDEPRHEHRLIEEQRVPMVGSVFQYRERMARFLAMALVRVSLRQPEMLRTLMPLFRRTTGKQSDAKK